VFVRVVRTPEGRIEVDETGRKNGRGAYLHQRSECWAEALKRDRMGRALRTMVTKEDADALRAYSERFEPARIAG
jgi:predicted RNA-binding protein YlxR (DUF448 family)